jgi:two-component system response regulator TctD
MNEKTWRVIYACTALQQAGRYKTLLEENGFSVFIVVGEMIPLPLLQETRPDIVLLDESLLVQHGALFLAPVRSFDDRIPILVLSSSSLPRASLREMGIDDFIPHRVAGESLCARARLAWSTRNAGRAEHGILPFFLSPSVTYNMHTRELVVEGRCHLLNPTVATLFHLLWQHQGQRVSSAFLCKSTWNNDDSVKIRQLHNYISTLRKHLSGTGLRIVTWYGGGGYTLCRDDGSLPAPGDS